MGEILPDGTIQSGYGSICKKCGVEIRVNIQGDEIDSHECKVKKRIEKCPKCGCQIYDPFAGKIKIHDIDNCDMGGYIPKYKEPPK